MGERDDTPDLAKTLEALERGAAEHYECEDGWYSCPKSESYFGSYSDTPISDRPCSCGQSLNLDAATLLRAMAADFAEYADHGLDDRGVACPKGDMLTRRTASVCTCGLDAARKRWALP